MTSADAIEASMRMIKTEDGEVPFLKDLWSFFSSKGVKTSFVTFNPEKTFQVDLEICEGLGCPIQIYTNKDSVEKRWEVISRTLKNRKIGDEDKEQDWLQGVEKKWILPKNIQVKSTSIGWTTLKEVLTTNATSRVDILKLETYDSEERMLLYSMIESGARPGLILVRYTEDPDANVPAMLAAGHLQNTGYRLLATNNNWFIYMFNDLCLYDSCSWRDTKVNNPLVQYIGDQFRSAQSSEVSTTISTATEDSQSSN